MPPDVPLWQVGLATAFAVVIGKAFGGTGMNVVNVALTARAFFIFRVSTSNSLVKFGRLHWWREKVVNIFRCHTFSYRCGINPEMLFTDLDNAFGSGWFDGIIVSKICLSGNARQYWRDLNAHVFDWRGRFDFHGRGQLENYRERRLPVMGMGLLMNAAGSTPFAQMPAYYHLVMGGLAFGAVFMATDPVTAAHTETGKWIYGFTDWDVHRFDPCVQPGLSWRYYAGDFVHERNRPAHRLLCNFSKQKRRLKRATVQ